MEVSAGNPRPAAVRQKRNQPRCGRGPFTRKLHARGKPRTGLPQLRPKRQRGGRDSLRRDMAPAGREPAWLVFGCQRSRGRATASTRA
jgi:hypothetical protein